MKNEKYFPLTSLSIHFIYIYIHTVFHVLNRQMFFYNISIFLTRKKKTIIKKTIITYTK